MAKDIEQILENDFQIEAGTSEYRFQIRRRHRLWWLLLSLLPLLLLVKCERTVTVVCLDAESKKPIEGAGIKLSYRSYFIFDDNGFFSQYDHEYELVTDENGEAEFCDLECSVFSYIFHLGSKMRIVAEHEDYESCADETCFHFHRKMELMMTQKTEHVVAPSTGDVQILMNWNDYNDLDLACMDPNGDMVWFNNLYVPSGGQLEIDMNAMEGESKHPIENIYWPKGKAPYGKYTVFAWMYNQFESNIPTSYYKIKVVYGDKTEWYEGNLSKSDGRVEICSFTFRK